MLLRLGGVAMILDPEMQIEEWRLKGYVWHVGAWVGVVGLLDMVLTNEDYGIKRRIGYGLVSVVVGSYEDWEGVACLCL